METQFLLMAQNLLRMTTKLYLNTKKRRERIPCEETYKQTCYGYAFTCLSIGKYDRDVCIKESY